MRIGPSVITCLKAERSTLPYAETKVRFFPLAPFRFHWFFSKFLSLVLTPVLTNPPESTLVRRLPTALAKALADSLQFVLFSNLNRWAAKGVGESNCVIAPNGRGGAIKRMDISTITRFANR
jgi:hypothetical protein